jgi:hypothetical protein
MLLRLTKASGWARLQALSQVIQDETSLNATASQQGDSNTLNLSQDRVGNSAQASQTGTGNAATIVQTEVFFLDNVSGSAVITQSGDNNAATINQLLNRNGSG